MSRKPTAIRLSSLDDTEPQPEQANTKAKTKSEKKRSPRTLVVPTEAIEQDVFDQTPFIDKDAPTSPPNHVPDMAKGIRWFSIFFTAIFALISIIALYKLQALIDEFFLIHPSLGWVVLGITALAGLALLALIFREIISLIRLRKLTNIREDAEQVLLGIETPQKVLNSLRSLYSNRADMRWHLDQLKSYDSEILDGADHLKVAEQTLMVPLDGEAKRVIATSAKRISVVTALNPSPVLDILFVGFQVLQMLRKIMTLYGGKPAFFGAMKLVRMTATHLAVTGGLALSDTLLQQFLGKGLAGRLSTKLGEGTVNGIMATRIGLAAIDICRPMPFSATERPSLKSMLGELFGS